ncbi:hypothetical protein F5884DRAFT_802360 [Xylogone sp. PMI_703]|nr:hypothetical protein F5884DRAFT_802360 [Xylogone sp. PMI_703]
MDWKDTIDQPDGTYSMDIAMPSAVEERPPESSVSHGAEAAPRDVTRVCNRCIVRKVKCDMRRPSCSRCLEASADCEYSRRRRKPGPPKGSRRRTAATSSVQLNSSTRSTTDSSALSRFEGSSGDTPTSSEDDSTRLRNLQSPEDPVLRLLNSVSWNSTLATPAFSEAPPVPYFSPFTASQEEGLIQSFFYYVHPAVPLFSQRKLLQKYHDGSLDHNLLLTILVMSAKIIQRPAFWTEQDLELCIKHILNLNPIENERPTKSLSLDNFRLACLLAFYSFHQFPGENGWTRIGQLTRKAYQCGLHQIDSDDEYAVFDHSLVEPSEIQEWKHVWWFIYGLDSYSNVTAATPFVVESESIKTALIVGTIDEPDLQTKIFLPDETASLWKTVQEISVPGRNLSFNMQIVSIYIFREIATVHRLQRQSFSERLEKKRVALEDDLSAIRLALPARFMNYTRDVMNNESSADHHARLLVLLHIHAARTLCTIPLHLRMGEVNWLTRWNQTFEQSEDIVSIVKQWDTQFFSAVDPAVCFIICGALTIIHLHYISGFYNLPEVLARFENHRNVLLLFLQQFAAVWTLPRLMKTSFERSMELISGPLSTEDIIGHLKQFTGPLHITWMKHCQPPPGNMTGSSLNQLDNSYIMGEWDFSNWESVVRNSGA